MKFVFRIIISVVFFLFIYYFAPLIISSSDLIRAIPGNTPLIFSEFCFLIFSLLFIALLSRFNFRNFGLKYVKIKHYWFPLVLVTIIYGGFLLFKIVFETSNSSQINISLFSLFLFYVLLPSLSEEIFIRGLIQSFLNPLKHFGFNIIKLRISVPVLLSIVYFIILHVGAFTDLHGNLYFIFYFLGIAFVGFLAAIYREKTDSIIPGFMVHFVVNIFSIFIPSLI